MFLKTRRADFPALHFFCDWVPTRDFSLDLQFPLENSPSIFALTPPPPKKKDTLVRLLLLRRFLAFFTIFLLDVSVVVQPKVGARVVAFLFLLFLFSSSFFLEPFLENESSSVVSVSSGFSLRFEYSWTSSFPFFYAEHLYL